MKRSLSRVLTIMVAITLTLGTVGCSKDSKQTQSTDNKELLKLDLFTMVGNYAGKQPGWFAKLVKDKFNIELNVISSNLQGGDTKYSTMMAAGNLGDIVALGADDQKYTDAIKAGLLLDWTKDGLLDKYGTEIVKTYGKGLEKAKENFGKGKSVYGLGGSIANMPATTSAEGNYMTWGPDLRWDLYEKLGKPTINSIEDFLPVLKQMQQLEPKSESGKPTYAFSMWADWDGNMMMQAKQFACMNGYDETGGFILVHGNQEKYQDILDPNGFYLRTLKLYYDANKMGLVDPDSISQKFDDARTKMGDGQTLFSWFPWLDEYYNTLARKNAGKGFELVPFKDEVMYSEGFANYGGKQIIAIGSKTKNPARVMQFINWLYTPEGVMESNYGPKGLAWDVKDGKPYVTEFGKKALPNNDVQVPEQYGGGTFKDGANQMNCASVKVSAIDPDFNEPYDYRMWQSTLNDNPSKVDQSWRTAMGAITPKEYLTKNNMLAVAPVTKFSVGTPDSTLQQKQGQIATIIKQNSWKMVFAKSDAEFNGLQKDMIDKAKGLGYDDTVKFWVEQAKKLFESRKTVK